MRGARCGAGAHGNGRGVYNEAAAKDSWERTLAKYAEDIGVWYSTLRNYLQVSRAFKNVRQRTNLPWSHHRVGERATALW